MLVAFSLLDVNFTPDSRQIQLNILANQPDSQLLLDVFYENHPNVVQLRGISKEFIDADKLKSLRRMEIISFAAEKNPSIKASFDISSDMKETACYTLAMTLIVTNLLALLSMLFSRDAYNIMIRPIEKMKNTIQQLSENPLLHLERMRNE